ncbi:hypothetical protein P153DRAFT_417818 [Dothidotthia symphoricarpi CBS 119687]|uniref:Uncharacterized protein n=1 Tax=Dothidotthia symphoricarpi CBS 119687 TaxID=1392245 RepID=A0A6A6AEE9_9PLEO|nr:uncharacterized protein P153DRAFT_417818 [Dothidotthia symphoricarpi CBS 119687]KAF2130312.1 hypothetical protein P153DRAFT_417818 [Dothidotthia symphoricarpi CBS 119687]
MATKNHLLANDSESELSEYSEDEQGQIRKRNAQEQNLASQNSSDTIIVEPRITSSTPLDVLKTELDALLDGSTRKDLINTMNQITWYGHRKSKALDLCREKLREIVTQNEAVRLLYNDYARLQTESEKRKSYQLPVFEETYDNTANKAQTEDIAARLEDTRKSTAQSKTVMQGPASPQLPITATKTLAKVRQTPISGQHCGQHSTFSNHCSIIPITNLEEFPIQRIQEVQAQRYPSTKILAMWSHRDNNGVIRQVTADIDGGSIDHLIINDPRIITALSVREGLQDKLSWDDSELKMDETFTIHVLPGQRPKNLKAWIVGELRSARHAYLYWLDHRRSADPKAAPYAQEARVLATKLGRRAPHVFSEIMNVWGKEQGPNGRRYRQNRLRCLGEDPQYVEDAEKKVLLMSMWG